MNHDREALKQCLASLPLPFIAVLTLRSALRYLPTFLELQDAPRAPQPSKVFFAKRRDERATPLTRLFDWFDKGSRERDAADERRLADRAIIFRSFYACHTAFFSTWFATASSDKQSIVGPAKHHAGEATHKGIVLGQFEIGPWDVVNWEVMVRATVFAASSATTAALVYAGVPPLGSLENQRTNAVSAAIGIADLKVMAAELAAEIAVVKETNAGISASSNDAAVFAEALRMLSSPLWPRGLPAECERTWLNLKQKLLGMDAGFDLWVAWYTNRLQGLPLDVEAEAQWNTFSNDWFEVDPVHAMAQLRALAQGGSAREPEPALLASARRENDAREQRNLRRVRAPLFLGRHSFLWRLLDPAVWRDAVRAAIDWRNLLPLTFATFAVVSFLMRHLGIKLHVPIFVFGLDTYTEVRDSLFSLSVPGWLKDLLFIYFYVGGTTYWVLSTYFASRRLAKVPFDLLRSGRRLLGLLWARIAWPWHFLGFYMGWVDPLRVYGNIDPEAYSILRASRDGDGSLAIPVETARRLDDSVKSILLARFIPFFVVYLFLVALTASLVLLGNALLGL
jgi:hypothetical protein